MGSVLGVTNYMPTFSVTYIYRVYISFMEGVHVAIWQKSVGKQREENKFRQSEKFVP